VAYRIMYHPHPRTGSRWCIYPTYDFSHCIVDALEDIDYSICTLEFENRRESYYWLLDALGLFKPKVFEMARLAVTRTVMSKRKLKRLVEAKQVRGWDDPRMPTLMGMRRRGYTKDMVNEFMKEIGISRAHSVIPMDRFLGVVSRALDESAPRVFGIVHPVPLVLSNVPEAFCTSFEAPLFPQRAAAAAAETRSLVLSRTVYVERDNCRAAAVPDFYGLFVGQVVRLRYGPLVQCTRVQTDAQGYVVGLEGVTWLPGLPNDVAEPAVKPKGILHWLSARPGERPVEVELRLYDHLMPDGDVDDSTEISPTSEDVVKGALVEPRVKELCAQQAGDDMRHMQFERVGYFVADCVDSRAEALVLNRTVGLQIFGADDKPAALQKANSSRAELQAQQKADKAERLKYPPAEVFKRPGVGELYAEWDADGVPTRMAGTSEPLSKGAWKKLRKEWEKHKEEWEAKQAASS